MKSPFPIVFILFLLLFSDGLYAQIITTYAGNGATGGGLSGVPATTTPAWLPASGGFDAAGNYYFMCAQNYIKKITPAGIVTTVAGSSTTTSGGDNGPATAAGLHCAGSHVDSVGNIYIADFYNFRIRTVDVATGIIHTIAGTGVMGSTGDGGPATDATVAPADVITDDTGNIYIYDNARIRKISITTGIISAFSPLAGGLCFDQHYNYLYVSKLKVWRINMHTMAVDTIAGTGVAAYNGDGIPATSANFKTYDIAISPDGLIYIGDYINDRIRKIDASGIIHTVVSSTGIAGYSGDNGPATAAQIYNPEGLAFDRCGNLYIADDNNNRVRKVWFAGMAASPTVTATATPNDTVCTGTAVTLTAAVTGADSTVSYKWYVNGTAVTGATNATYSYTPTNGDTISCKVQALVDCNGAFSITSNTIHLVTVSAATPTITITGLSTAAPGATVTITATVAGTGGSYLIHWMNHGSIFATTAVPLVTYIKGTGTDTITARIVPAGTCYDSVTSAQHVVTADHTGVASLGGSVINIYPTPVTDAIHVDGLLSDASYNLLGLTGTMLQHGLLQQGSNTIPLSQLPAGMYLLQLTGEDGRRSTCKIIK